MGARLLEQDGEAVSALMTSRVGDALTLGCMSTPERFGRHGFGRALLADTMARAASDGVKVGLLGATPAGKPLTTPPAGPRSRPGRFTRTASRRSSAECKSWRTRRHAKCAFT
jgi:hypothetical protein